MNTGKKVMIGLAAAMMLTGSLTAGAQETVALPGGESSYNLLMIGTDHRNDSWNGNSDVMILTTIDTETELITMTSFMRDLYADIPEYGVHKLNYAYAAGGGEKLEETLESNYQIEIDNYAVVDFEAMAEIIDILGGVDMEILDSECETLNMYLKSMNVPEYSIYQGGSYHLNGYQAVAYMRIRFVGNSDYQRTQRQRDVLKGVFASVQDLDAEDIAALAEDVLPQIEHNIGALQMVQLMAALPALKDYELTEDRIPYDDLYYSKNEMLVPDFEATIERLYETPGIVPTVKEEANTEISTEMEMNVLTDAETETETESAE